MSDWYSDDELERYFNDPEARKQQQEEEEQGTPAPRKGRWHALTNTPAKRQAVLFLSIAAGLALVGALTLGLYMFSLRGDMPPVEQIENPEFQFATVAYTASGKELARYARQNRSWITFDKISPHVIHALVDTEDHRFYDHWGIDMFRTMSVPYHLLRGRMQGGSTITQQLARNLYNDHIGREVSIPRKLKEMVTAVQLERRYTKQEIIEMYLNTVEYGYNAWGIEAASRTFFGKHPQDLNIIESATLVGLLNGTTIYNPVLNPENSKKRRNVVMSMMVKHGNLDQAAFDSLKEVSINARYHSSAVTASIAPYFAEYVHQWTRRWCEENGCDVYTDGLTVYTTLDETLQSYAQESVLRQMDALQAVVDYEWHHPTNFWLGEETEPYEKKQDSIVPFKHYFEDTTEPPEPDSTEQVDATPFMLVNSMIRETARYRKMRKQEMPDEAIIDSLRAHPAFMDSLRTFKTRLEGALVAIDPRTGHVKAWVGGRDLTVDWYDHVANARRQPGSTFKPFLYTAAIDHGYSSYHQFQDTLFTYVDETNPDTLNNTWSPRNTGPVTGRMMTLREALASSTNTVSGQLILEINPSTVAFYARRMGVTSRLQEVPSLALGTSNVTLLEMATGYSTLANGGLRNDPVVVTRIEDRYGNVLFEAIPMPQEALSEETAYTVVDMMRGVVNFGTGVRVRFQYGLGEYDLAAKTGTTQNSADGWFMMMHPELVTGAWVGFNDQRLRFRTGWWGQGAHNALFLVGDFFKQAGAANDSLISKEARFPTPEDLGIDSAASDTSRVDPDATQTRERGRIRW